MNASMELRVNGQVRSLNAEPETSLLEALRDDLGLTGAKYGCGESQCGACTVLIDGVPAHACVTSLADVGGSEVTTIEGIGSHDRLHPLQQAFLDERASQCGYCTPGMIMAAVGLLRRIPKPTEAEIIEHMNPNICRCGGYPRILAAIKRAAAQGGERR